MTTSKRNAAAHLGRRKEGAPMDMSAVAAVFLLLVSGAALMKQKG